MGTLPRAKWAKILVVFCYIIIGILSLYFLFSKVFAIASPFIFALIVGRLLQNPIDRLYKRIRLPRRLIGFVLNLILILFLVFVVVLCANQFISEAQNLFVRLSENSENIIGAVSGLFNSVGERFPFIYESLDREVALGTVTEVINNIVTSLSSKIAAILAGVIKAFPGIILFFTVFIIASFYFSMDYFSIKEKLRGYLPDPVKNSLSGFKNSLRSAGIKYIKAYSIILFITFAELFIGFIILKIDYAMVLALAIALLDMLPVIGTGTVLVPWAIIAFLFGNTGFAIGLLILFGVISVVREIIEPKIVGECIGMHPLLTLLSMYTGFRFFGVLGLVLLPIAVLLTKNTLEEKFLHRI